MNKQPKFFCENCKAEVRRDAMICPHCGRFFASVRCPSCGFTGTHKEFKDGCPSCGYAFSSNTEATGSQRNSKRKKAVQKLRYSGSGSLERSGEADPLPLWIYGLVVLLGAILAAIFYLY